MIQEGSASNGPGPLDSGDLLTAGSSADLRVTVAPEPTADERDAIVAALAVLMTVRTDEDDKITVREPTPWQRAAREEAIHGGGDFDDRRGIRRWR